MTNLKETREYQLAIENYKNEIKYYLEDKDSPWAPSQKELKAISKTLSFFGMTSTEEREIIREVRTELGLSK